MQVDKLLLSTELTGQLLPMPGSVQWELQLLEVLQSAPEARNKASDFNEGFTPQSNPPKEV